MAHEAVRFGAQDSRELNILLNGGRRVGVMVHREVEYGVVLEREDANANYNFVYDRN